MTDTMKGRTPIAMKILNERRRQLEKIRDHQRVNIDSNTSMTMVVEQLIDTEYRRLKI